MKIQSLQLKKLNITALFDKIDQSQITSDAIRDLFDLKAPERANTPFIELPGTKVLIIPTLKKEIVIEPNRLRVSDASTEDPAKSKVIKELVLLISKNIKITIFVRKIIYVLIKFILML